jgi:hypothetical protein
MELISSTILCILAGWFFGDYIKKLVPLYVPVLFLAAGIALALWAITGYWQLVLVAAACCGIVAVARWGK